MLAPTYPRDFVSIINMAGYYETPNVFSTYRFFTSAQELREAQEDYAYNRRRQPGSVFNPSGRWGGNPCGYGYGCSRPRHSPSN